MTDNDDTRERLIALEVTVSHLTKVIDNQARKIDEMYAVMQRGQGAWWMLMLAAGFAGFTASIVVKVAPWLFSMRAGP